MLQMNNAIIILASLLSIAGVAIYAVLAVLTHRKNKLNIKYERPLVKTPAWPSTLIIIGIIGIIAGNCFTVVPTGYTGVRTTFGLIDEESCMPGFNTVMPLIQKINLVNNKQQDIRVTERISAETNAETVVFMDNVVVTYAVVPESSAWIYAHVDNWVEELVDSTLIGDACRAAAKTCDNDNVTTRDVIAPKAKTILQNAVDEKYGPNRVEIKKIVIVNMTFEENYEKAIAKKSDALQEQQEQAIRNQIKIEKAEADAEAERRLAQGEADAERIRAEGKRDANKTVSETMTEATQRQDAIDKWDGALPRATGDNVDFGLLEIIGDLGNTKQSSTANTTAPTAGVTTTPATYTGTDTE